LKQFSEEPEDKLWSSITARVEAEDRAVRMQKKIRIGWIFIFSSTIIGGIFYYFNFEPQTNPAIVSAGTEQQIGDSMANADVTTNVEVKPDGKKLQPLLQKNVDAQKNADVKEIESRDPDQRASNFQSGSSLATQTQTPGENTSEKQGTPSAYSDNPIETDNE